MGLFDFFKKRKERAWPASTSKPGSGAGGAPPLEEIAYGVAYFVLPHYAHRDCEKIVEMWTKMPNAAGSFYYVMACQMQKIEPNPEAAREFRAHHRMTSDGRDCYVLEFPKPPPFVLPTTDIAQLAKMKKSVLAPYFAAVVRDAETRAVLYYVLGQAPMGGTTLRSVGADQTNYNLGPGPEPQLEAFVETIGKPPRPPVASVGPAR